MRFLLFAFCCSLSMSASAQFWQSKPKTRYPQLATVKAYTIPNFLAGTNPVNIQTIELKRAATYDMGLVEAALLKEAKHNMRFRIYNEASYNFSNLAAFYVMQNRFSEAKWYLLQSNAISRRQDNTRHTLDNLLALAAIQARIGETSLAKLNLQEALSIATARNLTTDATEINKRLYLLQTKPTTAKVEMRYAVDAVESAADKPKIN